MEYTSFHSVLIVDQHFLMRKTLCSYLHGRFSCHECANPDEALLHLPANTVDLVIASLYFDNVLEAEFISQIKQIRPKVKVIGLVHQADQSVVLAAHRAGVDAVVVKPVAADVLLDKITELLDPAAIALQTAPALQPHPALALSVETRDGYTIVTLAGKLIAATCFSLKERVRDLVKHGVRKLALNMARITQIDRQGCRLLAHISACVKALSGVFCLFNIFPVFTQALSTIDTLRAITMYMDEDDFKARVFHGSGPGMFYPNLRNG